MRIRCGKAAALFAGVLALVPLAARSQSEAVFVQGDAGIKPQAIVPPSTMSPEAAGELRAAIDLLKTQHMNRDRLNWPAVEVKAYADAANAKTAVDTYPVIQSIIRQLGEKHTLLFPAAEWNTMVANQQTGPIVSPPMIMPEGVTLAGNIGLLRLPGISGGIDQQRAYVAALRAELKHFQATHICRVAVDLRADNGGNVYPMLNGVVSLLGPQPFGYWLYGDKSTAWTLTDYPRVPGAVTTDKEAPYADPLPSQESYPFAVLVGPYTASAGEDTAIAFQGRKGVRLFGQTTAGFLSANTTFALPDGARLAISTSWISNRLGNSSRDTLVPDEVTAPGQDTIDHAIAWLKTQRC